MPDSAQKHQHGKAQGIGMSVPAPLGASDPMGMVGWQRREVLFQPQPPYYQLIINP